MHVCVLRCLGFWLKYPSFFSITLTPRLRNLTFWLKQSDVISNICLKKKKKGMNLNFISTKSFENFHFELSVKKKKHTNEMEID